MKNNNRISILAGVKECGDVCSRIRGIEVKVQLERKGFMEERKINASGGVLVGIMNFDSDDFFGAPWVPPRKNPAKGRANQQPRSLFTGPSQPSHVNIAITTTSYHKFNSIAEE